MKTCKNCNNMVEENSRFCGLCGCNEFIQKESKNLKRSKKIVFLILIVFVVIGVVVGGLFAYNSFFKKDKQKPIDPAVESSTSNTISTEPIVSEYIDYYSNIESVFGKYGLAELDSFDYCINGQYIKDKESAYGLISAFEYDCDDDSNNELITINLLPTDSGKAYLSISMFSNVGIISKMNQTLVSDDDTPDNAPILRNANEFSRIFVFLVDDKLCIIQDAYDFADIGKSSWFSDLFVYDLCSMDLNLIRHVYCHSDGWNCSIGETENNIYYTYNPTDFSVDVRSEWNNIKSTALKEIVNDVRELNLESYLCNEEELSQLDYITSGKLYEDNFFENDQAILVATIDTTSNRSDEDWNGTVRYLPTDYTEIRNKINVN